MARVLIKVHSSHDCLKEVLGSSPFVQNHRPALYQNLVAAIKAWKSQGKAPRFKAYSPSDDSFDHLLLLAPGHMIRPAVGLSPTHFSTQAVFWYFWRLYLSPDQPLDLDRFTFARCAIEARIGLYPYNDTLIDTAKEHFNFYYMSLSQWLPDELMENLKYIKSISVGGYSVGMEIGLKAGTLDTRPLTNLLSIDA